MRRERIANRGVLAALAVGCVTVLGSAMPLIAPKPPPVLDAWQQIVERCRHYARERLEPYPWPVKPFDRQHPVRGYFGDPRTVFTGPEQGTFSFHSGVDISAWPGNPVYPVVSGVVVKVTNDVIAVSTIDARRFQYVHLEPRVHLGQQVIASRTVLGTIRARWNHVHLTEIRGNCTVNPLMPGHLTPYVDTTRPKVTAISFQTPGRRPIAADALTGKVRIIARAFDTPALPSPYPWDSLPVSPVHVTWSLATMSGRDLVRQTAADFRYGLPFRFQFCSVYAQGTTQNFAAVVGSFHWGKAGTYLYDLTPDLFDTGYLKDGRYRLTVVAKDTGGNEGSRSTIIDVQKHARSEPLRVAPDTRCARVPVPTLAARSGLYAAGTAP